MSARFYTTEKLGPRRERTPEGFLICYDVPLARIGEQIYHHSEVPVPPGLDGWVRILREPDQVFAPVSISSAVGKPFVVFHPPGMEINPDNWAEYVAGHIQNVRRGEGSDADVMLGDLVIGRRDAIEFVESNEMVEVSMGYDCGYDIIGDEGAGLGRQRDIIFNHVALVPQGRCGPRCSIGDQEVPPMAAKRGVKDNISSFLARFRPLVPANDRRAFDAAAEELEKEVGDAEPDDDEGKHHVEIHNHAGGDRRMRDEPADREEMKERIKENEKKTKDAEERMDKIEDAITKIADAVTTLAKRKGGDEEGTRVAEANEKILGELEMEAPRGVTGDELKKMGDSAFMEESYQNVVADAEILAPGIRVPTFDAKLSPAKGLDMICGIRRKALDFAAVNPALAALIEQTMGGKTLDTKTAPCGQIRTVFNSVVGMQKVRNNDSAAPGGVREFGRPTKPEGAITSLRDLNKANDEFKNRSRSKQNAA